MKKSIKFSGTLFPETVVRQALKAVGKSPRLFYASVVHGSNSVNYDTEEQFFEAAAKSPTSTTLTVRDGDSFLTVRSADGDTTVDVEAAQQDAVDRVIEIFKTVAEQYHANLPEPIAIERFCTLAPLRWETLPLLREHLRKRGIDIEKQTIQLNRYPDRIGFSNWSSALADVRAKGEPRRYSILLTGYSSAGYFSVCVSSDRYRNSAKYYLTLDFAGVTDVDVVDDVAGFLGLVAAEPVIASKARERSAFIAHRFDPKGEQLADRLARFLQLLGFDVKTGRGFSPQSVGEKVKKRIATQAIVFAVLTEGDDATWLTQESIFGYAGDKPLFVLRDTRVEFKAAMLGDLEYITFEAPAMEGAFIPILEGLKDLGYLDDWQPNSA
jgi:hypothetical protein